VPPEIGRLKQLSTLSLPGNMLERLPPEIGELINLRILSLSRNRLTHLPNEIGKLSHLEKLWLEENYLSSLAQWQIRKLLPHTEIRFDGQHPDWPAPDTKEAPKTSHN
jgi:Leucine-rich repeat (LRR) protein